MEFNVLLHTINNRAFTYNTHLSLAAGGEFGWLGPVMNIWREALYTADDQLTLGIL